MISVPRLYASQCAKSINCEPLAKGINALEADEKLNILGQVQGAFMIGDAVLNIRWAASEAHKRKIISAITCRMVAVNKFPHDLSMALAEMVIEEVAGTKRCKKCNGTGEVFSKKQSKYNQCGLCKGAGQVTITHEKVLSQINNHLRNNGSGLIVSKEDWSKKYYDFWMEYVDELHKAESDAMRFASSLLRAVESEL